MTVQFPVNPSLNDTHVPANGVEYTWDGTKWLANKELTSGGGGGGGSDGGFWARNDSNEVLFPMKSGDGVQVKSDTGTTTIDMSKDGKIISTTIGFENFPDLTP